LTLRYLLDTNVISEPLRSKPSKGILDRIRKHEGEIAIAAIVWHELLFGCARLAEGARRTAIERYLHEIVAVSFPILSYDRAAAEWQALERARLVAKGKTPSFVDAQIAAIAHVGDLTLVTANKSHFLQFQNLRVEHWA
jgi:tRNA(fMet)-specific endonuclease VapC